LVSEKASRDRVNGKRGVHAHAVISCSWTHDWISSWATEAWHHHSSEFLVFYCTLGYLFYS